MTNHAEQLSATAPRDLLCISAVCTESMGERTSAAADACVTSARIGLHIAIIRAQVSRNSEPRHRDASDKRDDHNL